jgi:hypothetical protein
MSCDRRSNDTTGVPMRCSPADRIERKRGVTVGNRWPGELKRLLTRHLAHLHEPLRLPQDVRESVGERRRVRLWNQAAIQAVFDPFSNAAGIFRQFSTHSGRSFFVRCQAWWS